MEEIDFAVMAGAVAVGNLLTLSIFYSLRSIWHIKEKESAPWLPLLGALLPLLYIISVVITVRP